LLNCKITRLAIDGEISARDALGSGATVNRVHGIIARLRPVCRDCGIKNLPLGAGVIGAVFLVVGSTALLLRFLVKDGAADPAAIAVCG
jgi:hypothetical protein